MRVSVTVPIHNTEKYLPGCLDSILSQDFKLPYEIICVDDGSTDNSGKILDEYAQKYPMIKVIHQQNQGLSVARNTALNYVQGKYTMFVDSDDLIAKNTLSCLYSHAEALNADVVIFDFLRGGTDRVAIGRQHFSNIAKVYPRNTLFNISTADPFVYRFISVATWCKFYRTDLVKDIKFIKDLNNQDVPHWAEVYTKAKRISYLPEAYYFYTMQREGSITAIKGKKAFDVFIAFEATKKVLEEAGYFERFKNIHYAHFTCNLINKLRRINPDLRRKFITKIKSVGIILDFEKFMQDDFFQFEKDCMEDIRFILRNNYSSIKKYLIKRGIWQG
jgi:glycosyltransferase involved in cell wall biosynthesis